MSARTKKLQGGGRLRPPPVVFFGVNNEPLYKSKHAAFPGYS